MLATWRDGETRDLHQDMMRLTLRIVVRALFNVEAEQTETISTAHEHSDEQHHRRAHASAAGISLSADAEDDRVPARGAASG